MTALPQHPATPETETRAASAGFSVRARVRSKAEFGRVFEQGKRCSHPLLALHVRADTDADPGSEPRLGLAVSRKVDPRAVGRNRIKRALREQFRALRAGLAPGAYVVVVRPAAKQADNAVLRAAFVSLLQRAGALPPPGLTGTMPPASSSAPAPLSD